MPQCKHVHLTGSLSLPSTADVFTKVATLIGPAIARMPDGETGARGMWIGWQARKLANNPGLRFEEAGGAAVGHSKDYQKRNMLVVAPGNKVDDLHFDDLVMLMKP